MNREPTRPRSILRLVFVATALVILLLLAVAAVTAMSRYQSARRARIVTLPDGSTMELLGTVFGDNPFSTEKPWHRTARRVLPAWFHKWIPTTFTETVSGYGTNNLRVYFHIAPVSTNPPANPPWDHLVVEDDYGFSYVIDVGGSLGPLPDGSFVQQTGIHNFPRRQKDFLLHFVDGQGAELGKLRIPNPLNGPFPQWKPSPMPQTVTNGPVTLTLESITQFGKAPDLRPDLKWRVESGDPAWSGARVRQLSITDATGNTGLFLSPREPAWKLRASLYRTNTNWYYFEQFSLTNLPVPAPGTLVSLDRTTNISGLEIKVLLLAGAGRLLISNDYSRIMMPPQSSNEVGHSIYGEGSKLRERWSGRSPFFLVEVKNAQFDDEIQFLLRDDQRREYRPLPSGAMYFGTPAGIRQYQPVFTPAPDAKSLNLSIIVNRSLMFEFLINPADIQRNTGR